MEGSSSTGEGPRDASGCQSDRHPFRFTAEDRIRRSSDYRRIGKEGARHRTPHFYIRTLRNELRRTRLGIVAGRKVGNACARNRIKRRLREYFRLNRGKMPSETDIVFVLLEGAAQLSASRLTMELDRFFERKPRSAPDVSSGG
ncbi:MAG: ribonuclease P protein component [Deltaproteobacteria bacterium]|nr:ribonuclease P protein component [Deltaproteobacteria bacterium]